MNLAPMIIDSFAGGGGASTGIERALGRSPDVAINHSAAALALHAANHPDTLHLDSNIWDVDPRTVAKGRKVGLLWASPDCKHFSKAKGGAPRDRNVRDLAWVVVRWAEHVKPDVICMENVEEFLTWGPIDNEGQPIREFAGQTFDDWKRRLRHAGYKVQHRELRGCDYGAPTIRKRFFLVARCDGRAIIWPKPTHGDPNSAEVKRGKLLPWRTAAECIDWSIACPSIFDSKDEVMAKHGLRSQRPLADNTLARIARGMKRYVIEAERPFLVEVGYGERSGQAPRTQDIAAPLATVVAGSVKHALVTPYLSRTDMTSAVKRNGIYPLSDPLRTQMTSGSFTLVAPSLVSIAHGDSGGRREYPLTDPYGVVTAGGISHALIAPVLTYAQHGGAVRDMADPMHTITASRKDQNQLIVPHLLSLKGTQRRELRVDAPHPTILAGGNHSALIAPHIMTMRNSQKPFNGADEPVHTITAGGAGLTTVAGFLAQHNGGPRMGQHAGHDLRDPMSTIAASGSQQMPVAAWFAKYYGTGDGARMDEPLHTVTTKDRMGHMQAALQAPPFQPEHEARARAVAEFLRAHDAWAGGEFVTLTIDGTTFVVVDIGMRMLTPRELFNAQGFPPDYQIDGYWIETGGDWHWKAFPKDVQVSCCGNSVCPDLAAALVAANCTHLIEQAAAA
ncbi:MAG: DNA cytosine methyltransferase [Cypionkella sp.]|uniref:DNA cytosine methyltransferase n=1 Tax=Cypionkella sp. TaxID=2811411 RepID=UPI002730B8A8|nr:DNA cytosine methyltransferase [Cypionkella sp.]MDP2047588.1 DNA cytosine methyltransferase [Cypionkella sp.]